MAIGDPYLTVAEFKARTKSVSVSNDAAITDVLAAASRQIDGWCGRTFNKSASAEERVFGGWSWYGGRAVFEPGDLVSVSEIATDDGTGTYPTVWETDSYILTPRNAPAAGNPYTSIEPYPGIWWMGWPRSAYPIQITGIFGWPSVPAPIKSACFLLANREKSLWDAPFGQSGGGEMGSLDMTGSITPLIAHMLSPYRVMPV